MHSHIHSLTHSNPVPNVIFLPKCQSPTTIKMSSPCFYTLRASRRKQKHLPNHQLHTVSEVS